MFKSGVFLTKFGHILLFSLSAQPDYVWKCWKKIIARTLCLMHRGIFRTNYSFNNDVFYFRAQKIPFDLF